MYNIDKSCTWIMPLARYSKISMITLRIWVFKYGVLKRILILSKDGTNANIISTTMANNRHAYNRGVLQSYWTSDGISLFCSQPTGEKTHTNLQCERLAKIRKPRVTSDRDDRALQRLVRRMPFATSSVLNNTGCPIEVCQQEQLETVWNQRDLSQGDSLNVHCWQTEIDDHAWNGV